MSPAIPVDCQDVTAVPGSDRVVAKTAHDRIAFFGTGKPVSPGTADQTCLTRRTKQRLNGPMTSRPTVRFGT